MSTCLLELEVPMRLRPARSAPSWVNEMVIYQIWLRSFTPEGTLKAASRRLSYLAELGVDTVQLSPLAKHSVDDRETWLSPRTKQSKAGHYRNPYRISDYDVIDPEYGCEEDLRSFVKEAHRLGLRVLLDVVFYHTGPDCTLIKEHPEFYHRDREGRILNGDWNFPALNFESQDLRRYLIGNLAHWITACGVDGFRCDVSFGVPLNFWEEAREALDVIRPDLILVAESEVPEDQLQAFDINYNFSYYDTLKAVMRHGIPATRLREYWEIKRAQFPTGARHLYCSDNHDMDRADVVFGREGAAVTAVLNFTLDGVPYIFNGQEIGDANPDDILSHEPVRWDLASYPAAESRRKLYQQLLHLRRTKKTLTRGDLVWIANSSPVNVLSYIRQLKDDAILVVTNVSNRVESVSIPASPDCLCGARELLSAQLRKVQWGAASLSVELGAYGFGVFSSESFDR